MNTRLLIAIFALAWLSGTQRQATGRSANASATHVRSEFIYLLNENLPFQAASDKPDCDKYYPLPDNYQNWTSCKKNGGSACGGPQQCGCLESQRLITFACDQGTYHQCYGEQGNGCKGN